MYIKYIKGKSQNILIIRNCQNIMIVETKKWDYVILSDVNQDLQRALNFQSVPQTFLLDQEGNIVYTHTGYVSGDEYELEDKIKALAGK